MRNTLLFLCMILVCGVSCKKESGEGGNSSISGKIQVISRQVSSNPASGVDTLNAADEDVYIIYGDHVSADDRIRTNASGEFEFRNLREGNYTIYVYSDDTTGIVNPGSNAFHLMEIKVNARISDKKSELKLPLIAIYEDL